MKYSARDKINSLGAIKTFQLNRPNVFKNPLKEVDSPLAEVYGLGTICENGIYPNTSVEFGTNKIKKLLKYRTLGYKDVYLFDDGFGIILDTNKHGIDITDIDYVRSNLRIWGITKPIRLKGLFMKGGRLFGNTVTVTDFAEIRNARENKLLIDGLKDLNLVSCDTINVSGTPGNNAVMHIIDCENCSIKLNGTGYMHIGLYDSKSITLDIGSNKGTIKIAHNPLRNTDKIVLRADSLEVFNDIELTLTYGLNAEIDRYRAMVKIVKDDYDCGLEVKEKFKCKVSELFRR